MQVSGKPNKIFTILNIFALENNRLHMIDDKFLENIPLDLNNGAMYFINSFFEYAESVKHQPSNNAKAEEYIDYYLAIEAYLNSNDYGFEPITLDFNKVGNIQKILNFFNYLKADFERRLTSDKLEQTKEKYNLIFNNSFSYEFTQGDLERIQGLLNELRNDISLSELFTAEHKQRLLKRLERLQSELHKKVSDLDRFWGLIGDAGIAIGKFGKDAKPFVDRIKEIADIVWRTQARKEELPSGTTIPFLMEGKPESDIKKS